MSARRVLIAISVCLCGLSYLVFAYPHWMVAPGPLMPAHAGVSQDCFACHAPFQGVRPARCISCHQVADIGLRTTLGKALDQSRPRIAFHQALLQADCMSCHTEHSRPELVKNSKPRFAHRLLRPDVGGRCASCHRVPSDSLHRLAGSNCAQCHAQVAWKPATFDHERYFDLSGPHAVTCATCHATGDFKRYTCYGCHEHQPDRMRVEHAEEGIRNIENCARCHRSGSEEGGEDD